MDSPAPSDRGGGPGVGPARVLLAEDDHAFRALVASVLRREGYDVIELADGVELLEFCASNLSSDGRIRNVDMIVSDVRMPGFSGLDLLVALRRVSSAAPVILVTAFADATLRELARMFEAVTVIDKPFDIDELCGVILASLLGRGLEARGAGPC